MSLIKFIRKLVGLSIGISSVQTANSINIQDVNYILSLNPISLANDSNYVGLFIIVMLIAIVILIGYTLFNNKNK